jgi:transposase-like protein
MIWTEGTNKTNMIVRTTVFELCHQKYRNISELARAMGLSSSQLYRVREGKRPINQKFIVGAAQAFPERRLEELFYLSPD